jgi:lipid A 3-O-deacylase
MKRFYKFVFGTVIFFYSTNLSAQTNEPSKMIRLYEENDFFNLSGHGTDRSYSNGTRIDFFYEKQTGRGLFHKLMPKAGDNSRNLYGWSLMQIMVTPNDISTTSYVPDDYPYAGALFVTHSLYSYNPKKKYSFQTELLAGIRGPASFAKQMQKAVHKLMDYQEPMGWDNQLRTQPLINLRIGVEKSLLPINNFIELNAGAQLKVGSLMDLVTVYPMLRIGKMSPYFNGYMDKFGSFTKDGKLVKTQYYFVVKPSVSYVAYNAMLTGKCETPGKALNNEGNNETSISIHNVVTDVQFGAVVAHGNFAISYLQTTSAAYSEGLYKQCYGNLSLFFRW